jgi:hypothetical protein
MSSPIKELSKEEIAFRTETMRRRLQSRCKGLLEVSRVEALGPEAKVQYLHRTVREFLEQPDIWEYLLSGTQNSFDPNSTLIGAFLLQIKTMKPVFVDAKAFFLALTACIECSLKLENTAREVHISVLNELERAVSGLLYSPAVVVDVWDTYSSSEELTQMPHWKPTYDLVEEFRRVPFSETDAFFIYAFQYPLYSYVQYKLSIAQPAAIQISDHSLLYQAVDAMDLKMIQLLFDNELDPNTSENDSDLTPWRHLLLKVQRRNVESKLGTKSDVAEIINMFLEHKPDTLIKIDKVTAEELVEQYLQAYDPERVQELMSKFATLKKTQKRQSRRFRNFLKRLSID